MFYIEYNYETNTIVTIKKMKNIKYYKVSD